MAGKEFITMGRRPATLQTVLFWNMVLIALAAVVVVGSLLHASLVRTIRQGAEDEQTLVARTVGRRIETSLLANVNLLQVAAHDPSLLPVLCRTRPEVEEAYALDASGSVTLYVPRLPQPPPPPRTVADVAARYFQSGGRFYITAGFNRQGEPVALVAVPQSGPGREGGILLSVVSAQALADPLTGVSEDRRIGVYLATEDGRFVGSRRPGGLSRVPDQVRDRAIRQPVDSPWTDVVGESLVTVMRAPWTGWPIMIRESSGLAFSPIRLARWAFFVLTPLAMGIAVLLSVRQAALIAGKEASRIERLAVAVVEAQERERHRIAQDIHDWTAQRITSSYYHVQLLEKLLAKSPEQVAKELPQLGATLDSANTELREIMRNLHPHLLNELGLAAAVRELVTDFARSRGLEHSIDIQADASEPPKHLSIALFRILQEALNNIEKHADAERIEVSLHLLPDRGELKVRDDGRGFDPAEVSVAAAAATKRTTGLGLSGMRERAELLGGTFTLSSAPGKGTTIEVNMPWNLDPNRLSAS